MSNSVASSLDTKERSIISAYPTRNVYKAIASIIELDNIKTRSGALFKRVAPGGVETTGKRPVETHCADRKFGLQSVADCSEIQ